MNPQIGSTVGGNVTINGLYFYNDFQVPAKIEIGGEPCSLVDFNMKNLPNTTFTCLNSPQPQSKTDYYGNRGINLIRENVYTALGSFATATPGVSAEKSIIYKTDYSDTQLVDVTVWLKGYFSPRIDSAYEFSLITNGEAKLYISTDESAANKVRQLTEFKKIQIIDN